MTDQPTAPADLREAYDRATARVTELEAENRGLKLDNVFKDARVPKASQSLYSGDDITVEAVTEWANFHGIPVAPEAAPVTAPTTEPAPALTEDGRAPAVEKIMGTGPTPEDAGLASMAAAAGSHEATAAQALPSKMSHQQFTKMLENPDTHDQAVQAYAEGRVDRNDGNVQADQMKAKGLIR